MSRSVRLAYPPPYVATFVRVGDERDSVRPVVPYPDAETPTARIHRYKQRISARVIDRVFGRVNDPSGQFIIYAFMLIIYGDLPRVFEAYIRQHLLVDRTNASAEREEVFMTRVTVWGA